MPNHIHHILYFKKANNFSIWMRDFKKFTSVKVRQQIEKSGNIELLEKLRVPETQPTLCAGYRLPRVFLSLRRQVGKPDRTVFPSLVQLNQSESFRPPNRSTSI
jgi:hypothetical protein